MSARRSVPSTKRTRAIPLRLRHLPCPYCRRKRARSRTPLPLANVSMEVISPTISKSMLAHASKQRARVQIGSRTLALSRARKRQRSGRCKASAAAFGSAGDVPWSCGWRPPLGCPTCVSLAWTPRTPWEAGTPPPRLRSPEVRSIPLTPLRTPTRLPPSPPRGQCARPSRPAWSGRVIGWPATGP